MAFFNFANTYAEISGKLNLTQSDSGDYVSIYISKDGHFITHGKDLLSDFNGTRGLVPTSDGSSTKVLRGNGTWGALTTSDLPIAASVANAVANGTTSTTLLNTLQIIDYVAQSFVANDAMRYKGTIKYSSSKYYYNIGGSDIEGFPTSCEVGDTYRVTSAGTYAGQTMSAGDLLICIKSGSVSSSITTLNDASYWTAVESNINGEVSHKVNGTTIKTYSSATTTFTIFAPTTGGTLNQVLISQGTSSAPTWTNQSNLVAGSVSKALSLGTGLSFASGTSYNGSTAMTINLKAATASSLGGVTVDKDSTGTITLSSGNIYLTKDNVVAALGYTPGNVASEKTYTAIFGSSTTGTTAVTAATSNPYLNLLQTVSGTSTVASTLQFAGSGNVTVSANDTKITFGLNAATSSNFGGIKIGFSTNATNRNYAVQLSSGQAYVNVPWVAYTTVTDSAAGLAPKPSSTTAADAALASGNWVLARTDTNSYKWCSLPSTAFTDSWRPIQVAGTSIGTDTLNLDPSESIYIGKVSNSGITTVSFGLQWYNISTSKYETA